MDNWVEDLRNRYVNWWEKMFWPPDDWGNMTPEMDEWISGQSARWESAPNIKAFIRAVKPHGIRSITYGKHVAMGPSGWELVRRKPEWFHRDEHGRPSGSFHTLDLHRWNDFEYHKDADGRFSHDTFISTWWSVSPDLRQVEVVDWGISEILGSTREFGWDGIRFDGHWTAGNDALSTWNMQRLKRTVWEAFPEFEFGFNYSWSHGHHTSHLNALGMVSFDHEYRESMAGGGMHMQEAIRSFQYAASQGYTSWRDYATSELRAAHGVHQAGGHYHFIYDLQSPPPQTAMLKLVLGTAAGAHPVYSRLTRVPGCPNWGRFLTRWSGVLWDGHLQPLTGPDMGVSVDAARPVWWREWVRDRIVDGRTRQLVVHVINPPASDRISAEDELPAAAVDDVRVRIDVPKGQRFMRAARLDPSRGHVALPLPVSDTGSRLEAGPVRVPVWNILVFEFTGEFRVPADPPRMTAPPDPVQVAQGRQRESGPAASDPMRPDAEAGADEFLFETDSGFNSVPALATADPLALNGRAQYRPEDKTSVYFGRTWMGALPAGKYNAHMRIRLETLGDAPVEQSMRMRMLFHDVWDYNVTFGTDHKTYPEERRLIADGQYRYYTIPFEMPVPGWPCMIGGAYTEKPGTSRFYLDHIRMEQLEAYTDAKLFASDTNRPPAGLVPGGEKGMDLLLVKGWTWDTYGLDALPAALGDGTRVKEVWVSGGNPDKFPQKHEELYGYDVVVVANAGGMGMGYNGRRALRDFVQAGGGLVVLGGMHTLGQGRFFDTFMEGLLPVQLQPRDVERSDTALVLSPAKRGDPLLAGLASASWNDRPVVYWLHRVQPAGDATVHVVAGDRPVLISRALGKGRVIVFAGTALGEPRGEGELPFWSWTAWPQLLARTVQWAGAGVSTQ